MPSDAKHVTNGPIGVFDSGVGGLTVLAALRARLPNEDLIYLGDTARVPYGTRSPETVQRYSSRVAGHLWRRGIKALVVACNTASTWALEALVAEGRRRGIHVEGVIEPGVQAALASSRTRRIGVIGTEGTIRGGRYAALLLQARPDVVVDAIACPLFVALAEEGWTEGEVARLVAERYLAPLKEGPDTVILGCTHYPLLKDTIGQVLPGVTLVDSAQSTAAAVERHLQDAGLRRADPQPGQTRLLVTDNQERFHAVGSRFLHAPIEHSELVDLADGDEWFEVAAR